MKVFQTNFLHLAVLLIPTMLRKPAMVAMMRSFMKPFMLLQNRLNERREANMYNLMHTGQVCHIKSVLDDYFRLDYWDGFEIDDVITPGEWLMTYDEGDENPYHIIPIVDDEFDCFIAYGDTDENEKDTGDEPGDIHAVVILGINGASNYLWDEKIILYYTDTFTVYVPENIIGNTEYMTIVRTIVNKYRLASRSPEYQPKNV